MNYERLFAADLCDEGREWLIEQQQKGLTLAQAWDVCPRFDWMLWALDKLEIELTEQQNLRLQLLALETPLADKGTVMDLVTDERSLAFIDLKRRRLAGEEISEQTWVRARDAAWDAVRAAAHVAGGGLAAWAAMYTTVRATACAAAPDITWLDTQAAAEDAALAADWDGALTWQADRLREIVGNPF